MLLLLFFGWRRQIPVFRRKVSLGLGKIACLSIPSGKNMIQSYKGTSIRYMYESPAGLLQLNPLLHHTVDTERPAYVYACLNACMYVCSFPYASVYAYVCIHIHVFLYIYICMGT